jgi:hypothetical protein
MIGAFPLTFTFLNVCAGADCMQAIPKTSARTMVNDFAVWFFMVVSFDHCFVAAGLNWGLPLGCPARSCARYEPCSNPSSCLGRSRPFANCCNAYRPHAGSVGISGRRKEKTTVEKAPALREPFTTYRGDFTTSPFISVRVTVNM